MVAAYPARVDERRLLASLLGRTEQWDRAIAQADAAAGIAPEDASLHAARIQLRVQAGRIEDAAGVARQTHALALAAPRRRALVDAGLRAPRRRGRGGRHRGGIGRDEPAERAWPRWPCAPCSTTTG